MTAHLISLVLRTMLMYFTAFAVMRIMGKREIGELSIFDLVISIMIAEIAVFAIEDMERPLYDGFVPMITLLLIQIVIALLSLRSRSIRFLFDGKPSVIIQNGQINREEMKRQRYNLDDLMMQLRANNIDNVADVEFAVLETSGQLSVMSKSPEGSSRGSAEDRSVPQTSNSSVIPKIRYEEIPLSLIMDGKVQDYNLEQIGKTRFWLKNQIQARGVKDFKEIFFCSIDHQGKLYINLMQDK
ncbi:YetF domain-containing protein [Paenibacillus lentus]|uniref:YetF domain-containing protein n=1 Tax=Paenibacillus lentus TaxID=1338368 RepID=UPI003655A1AA